MGHQSQAVVRLASVCILILLGLGVNFANANGGMLPERHSESFDYPYADSYAADSYPADWSNNWDVLSGRHSQAKCIDIPQNLSLCRNIGYNQMRLPNLLDHDTVSEVVQQASSWVPLLGIRCHPDTKLFLCSLFSPVCLDRPIWPCRSLCNSVKTSCLRFMNKYGFPWPDMLRCDKFPLDNDLCIGLQNEQKEDDTVCEACSKPETYESIVHNYCVSEFVVRMGIQQALVVGNDMKLVPPRKKKIMKKGALRRRQVRSLELFVANGRSCECPLLNATGAAPSRNNGGNNNANQQYLVMGRMEAGRALVNFVTPYNKRDKDTKRAMRALKKTDICKSALAAITGDSANTDGTMVTTVPGPTSLRPGGNTERGNGNGRGGNRGNRNKGNRGRKNQERERGNGRQRKRKRNRDREEGNGRRRNKRRNNNNNNNRQNTRD